MAAQRDPKVTSTVKTIALQQINIYYKWNQEIIKAKNNNYFQNSRAWFAHVDIMTITNNYVAFVSYYTCFNRQNLYITGRPISLHAIMKLKVNLY